MAASKLIRSRSQSQVTEKANEGVVDDGKETNKRGGDAAALDSRLFLVRHLLILKEMVQGMDSRFSLQRDHRRGGGASGVSDFGGVTG